MEGSNEFEIIRLLNKYGIDGKKFVRNNPKILVYGELEQIEKISVSSILRCPSILLLVILIILR